MMFDYGVYLFYIFNIEIKVTSKATPIASTVHGQAGVRFQIVYAELCFQSAAPTTSHVD